MTLLFSGLPDLVIAVLTGLGASVALSAVLGLRRLYDEKRNRSLMESRETPGAIKYAAAVAELEDSEVIHDVLESAVADVAADQQLPPAFVRGALFAQQQNDKSLRILAGQTVGFEDQDEALIEMQEGKTGVGEAAESAHPVITVFESPQIQTTIEAEKEREQINPALRWIISVPILESGGKPLWILTVEGLVESRTTEQLRSSVARLLYYQEILEMLVHARARAKQP